MCLRISNLTQLKVISPILFNMLDESWLSLIGGYSDGDTSNPGSQSLTDVTMLLSHLDTNIEALVNFVAYRVGSSPPLYSLPLSDSFTQVYTLSSVHELISIISIHILKY